MQGWGSKWIAISALLKIITVKTMYYANILAVRILIEIHNNSYQSKNHLPLHIPQFCNFLIIDLVKERGKDFLFFYVTE